MSEEFKLPEPEPLINEVKKLMLKVDKIQEKADKELREEATQIIQKIHQQNQRGRTKICDAMVLNGEQLPTFKEIAAEQGVLDFEQELGQTNLTVSELNESSIRDVESRKQEELMESSKTIIDDKYQNKS